MATHGSNSTGTFDLGDSPGTAVVMTTAAGILLILGLLLSKVFRRTPDQVEVNCWFCQADCTVPHGNQNCWDCPHCDQYNGFQEDGDYNKPIPAQHHEELNYDRVSGVVSSPGATPSRTWNILCPSCNRKQLLKVQQLAEFLPTDEAAYAEEVEAYRCHLEQLYQLCWPCQVAVGCHLRRLDQTILAGFMGDRLCSFHPRNYAGAMMTIKTPLHITLLRLVAATVALVLVVLNLLNIQTFPTNLQKSLPDLLHHVVQTESTYMVVFVGLFLKLTAVLLAGKDRLRRRDALCVLLWLLTLGVHIPRAVGKQPPGVGILPPGVQRWFYVAISTSSLLSSLLCVFGKNKKLRQARKLETLRPLSPLGSDMSYFSQSPTSVPSTPSIPYSPPRPRSPLTSVRQTPNRAPVPDNFDTLSIGKHSTRSYHSHTGQFGLSHSSPASLFTDSRNTLPQFGSTLPHVDTTLPHTGTTLPQFGNTSPHVDTTVPHTSTTLPQFDTHSPQFGRTSNFGRNLPLFGMSQSSLHHRSQRPILSPAKFQPLSSRARQSPSRELIGVKSLSIHDDGEIRKRPRQLFSDGEEPLTTPLEQEADVQYETSSAYGSGSISGSDATSSDGGNTTSSCRVHSTTTDQTENPWRPVAQAEKPTDPVGNMFAWKWLFGLSLGCNTVLAAYVVMQMLSSNQT